MSGENHEADSPWDILCIGKDAGAEEIRTAYRKRSAEWHPDRCPDPALRDEWNEQMRKVNWAYDLLADPVKLSAWRASHREEFSADDVHHEALDMLQSVTFAVAGCNEAVNMADECRSRLRRLLANLESSKDEHETHLSMRNRILARLGGPEGNLLKENMRQRRDESVASLKRVTLAIAGCKLAMQIADDYFDPGMALDPNEWLRQIAAGEAQGGGRLIGRSGA